MLTEPQRSVQVRGGNAGARDTVGEMQRLVQWARRQPGIHRAASEILRGVDSRDVEDVVATLHAWVAENVDYRSDPAGLEMLRSAEVTLGERAGDCDCQAVLVASLLAAVGVQPLAFGLCSEKGSRNFTHVIAGVDLGDGWVPLDTTENVAAGEWPSQVGDCEWHELAFSDGYALGALGQTGAGELDWAGRRQLAQWIYEATRDGTGKVLPGRSEYRVLGANQRGQNGWQALEQWNASDDQQRAAVLQIVDSLLENYFKRQVENQAPFTAVIGSDPTDVPAVQARMAAAEQAAISAGKPIINGLAFQLYANAYSGSPLHGVFEQDGDGWRLAVDLDGAATTRDRNVAWAQALVKYLAWEAMIRHAWMWRPANSTPMRLPPPGWDELEAAADLELAALRDAWLAGGVLPAELQDKSVDEQLIALIAAAAEQPDAKPLEERLKGMRWTTGIAPYLPSADWQPWTPGTPMELATQGLDGFFSKLFRPIKSLAQKVIDEAKRAARRVRAETSRTVDKVRQNLPFADLVIGVIEQPDSFIRFGGKTLGGFPRISLNKRVGLALVVGATGIPGVSDKAAAAVLASEDAAQSVKQGIDAINEASETAIGAPVIPTTVDQQLQLAAVAAPVVPLVGDYIGGAAQTALVTREGLREEERLKAQQRALEQQRRDAEEQLRLAEQNAAQLQRENRAVEDVSIWTKGGVIIGLVSVLFTAGGVAYGLYRKAA